MGKTGCGAGWRYCFIDNHGMTKCFNGLGLGCTAVVNSTGVSLYAFFFAGGGGGYNAFVPLTLVRNLIDDGVFTAGCVTYGTFLML